jgi:type IV secretory pathway VirJ component
MLPFTLARTVRNSGTTPCAPKCEHHEDQRVGGRWAMPSIRVRAAGHVWLAVTIVLAVVLDSPGGRVVEAGAAPRPPGARDSADVAALPLVERPAAGDDPRFAVLLTGDGGFVEADKSMAAALNRRGISVVGFDSRQYLTTPRTPEVASLDLARIIRHYTAAWRRPRVLIVGYSRGADIGPFMVNRLPDGLRSSVALVALIGPGPAANFHFHWVDLLKRVARPDDVLVEPELEKLRGIPIACIYGRDDHDAICPRLDPNLARIVERDAGHRVGASDGEEVVALILGPR